METDGNVSGANGAVPDAIAMLQAQLELSWSIAPPGLEANLLIPTVQSDPVHEDAFNAPLLHILNGVTDHRQPDTGFAIGLVDPDCTDQSGLWTTGLWECP